MAYGDSRDRIDPRFDPAFQRGYRPQKPRSAGAAPYPSAQSSTSATPRERAVERPVEPSDGRSADSASADNDSVGGADDSAGGADEIKLAPIGAPPRKNPYVVCLLVIGVGLVVAGVGLQVWAQTASTSVSYEGGQLPLRAILFSLAYAICGPMITVGLGTIVGLLFLLAARAGSVTRRR